MILTRHELTLIHLYRAAPYDLRGRLDGELFDSWCRLPCSLDPQSPETLRHKLIVERMHRDHIVGRALSRFATFWTDAKGGA